MPQDFDQCVADGGKVITKKLNEKQYIHVCYSKDGKPHSGQVKAYKKAKK